MSFDWVERAGGGGGAEAVGRGDGGGRVDQPGEFLRGQHPVAIAPQRPALLQRLTDTHVGPGRLCSGPAGAAPAASSLGAAAGARPCRAKGARKNRQCTTRWTTTVGDLVILQV